jgi:hypothetical protein
MGQTTTACHLGTAYAEQLVFSLFLVHVRHVVRYELRNLSRAEGLELMWQLGCSRATCEHD